MKTFKMLALLAAAALLYGCGGDGGSGGGGGASTLKLNGGSAFGNISSSGGSGGDIYIDSYGDVKVMRGGFVDVSFTVPTPSPTFGNQKATVFSNSSTSVLLDPVPNDAIGNGRLFQITGDSKLYVTKSATFKNQSTAQVSGLEVQANAKLKLPAVHSKSTSGVLLPKAVVIDGTVTTLAESVNINIESYANDGANYGDSGFLKIGPAGKVTTKPKTAGANGGYIYLYSGGMVINQGVVDASGADGTVGGNAGYAELDAESYVYNTGSMLSNGGAGSAGNGGSSDGIYLYSYVAGVYTSGILSANGGAAIGGNGGSGSYIECYGGDGYLGRTIVGGTLTANGGNATNGNGGSTNTIYLYSYGSGGLNVNAAITAMGGNSTGAGFSGGSGANLYLYQDYEYDYGYGEQAPLEGIKLAGNIDLSGGSGERNGGSGGYLDIDLDNYTSENLPPNATVELYGYASFSLNGGDGAWGGDGGYYEIYTEDAYAGGVDFPTGAITSQVDVSAKGGKGSTAAVPAGYRGGRGGWLEFEAEGEMYAGLTTMTNTGNVEVSGGDGDFGGDSGGVYFYGHDKMTNNGSITANGGNGTTQGGEGGYWSIEFYSTLDVVNTGAINASGGSGKTGGIGCDYVVMYAGNHLTNSGAITAKGGNGTVTGGNGGYVDLLSEYVPTTNSGVITVTKGTGGTTAIEGWIFIDLVDVGPPHDLPAPFIPLPV